ncbi:MAG: aminotransferase class V-fold PLP-dependent enzyme [Owenweeksia sp.]|nr:aminotransferase class V-fold PLP-dependent enzyme [Owenweeksia sp.]
MARYLHSDTVQTLGHFPLDLQETPIDFITASAHKFHGPERVGFLYMNSDVKVGSYISGGAQERNDMRGGTENILGISGLHQALKWSLQNMEQESQHIVQLKEYFMSRLKAAVPDVSFNGLSGVLHKSLYTVISVAFKARPNGSMFLFNLDLKGIAVSGGSACASGSAQGSHVIQAILPEADYPVVRFSLGKDTAEEELDYTIGVLQNMATAQ